MRRGLTLLLLLPWTSLSLAAGPAASSSGPAPKFTGLRCGAPSRPVGAVFVPGDCTNSITNPLPSYDPGPLYIIQVAVHIIMDTSGNGAFTDAEVQSQIDVLNEGYQAQAGTQYAPGTYSGIQFVLASTDPSGNPTTGITRTTNNSWFSAPDISVYASSLNWDPNRYLNFYTQDLGGSILGYVSGLPADPGYAGSAIDGVVIEWNVWGRPGNWAPFDLGGTALHEVGHWFGLFHTFDGAACANGGTPACYGNGDLICDTNPQASPTSGCPAGRNSCGVGLDPIDNFLDYSDDICYTKLTPEQVRRARCSLTAYRPNAYSTGTTSGLDYLVGEGLAQPNPNTVKAFTPAGGATPVNFNAYGAGQYGVNVAAGNIDSSAEDEIVTGPGPGAVYGPQVRGFQKDGTTIAKINFYAYGTLKFGVNVATADDDNDIFYELLSGAGPGAVFGPHVRGFNYDGSAVTSINKISFFAYGTLKFGVNVAPGDVDGDGYHEILTGPGPSGAFGPTVRGFNVDAGTATSIAKINFGAFAAAQFGVRVDGGFFDADAYGEIACAPGPGGNASFQGHFKGFNYDGSSIAAAPGFDITPYTTNYGGRVGHGDVDNGGQDDLVASPGPAPLALSTVRSYSYNGSALTQNSTTFTAFGAATYGVNPTGANLGY